MALHRAVLCLGAGSAVCPQKKAHDAVVQEGFLFILLFQQETLKSNVWFIRIYPEINGSLRFKVYNLTVVHESPMTSKQRKMWNLTFLLSDSSALKPHFYLYRWLIIIIVIISHSFKQQLKTIPSLYWEGTPGLLFYFSKERRRPAPASQLSPLTATSGRQEGASAVAKGLSPSTQWTSRVHPLLNQHSRRAQHPGAVVTPSLRVSIVSPRALACSWCGVEACSVHTPPPFLISSRALRWPAARAIRGFRRHTQHGEKKDNFLKTKLYLLLVCDLFGEKGPSLVLFYHPFCPLFFFFALWSGHACQKDKMLSINRLIIS